MGQAHTWYPPAAVHLAMKGSLSLFMSVMQSASVSQLEVVHAVAPMPRLIVMPSGHAQWPARTRASQYGVRGAAVNLDHAWPSTDM